MAEVKAFQVEKPWGNFRQFTHNSSSTVKIITVNPGEALSLQSHKKRAEFWKVVKGDGIVEIDGVRMDIGEGGECEVPQGSKHRLAAGRSGIMVLEIATGDFDENDIVRFEDKYGRA